MAVDRPIPWLAPVTMATDLDMTCLLLSGQREKNVRILPANQDQFFPPGAATPGGGR
jgi:hypothetical protein